MFDKTIQVRTTDNVYNYFDKFLKKIGGAKKAESFQMLIMGYLNYEIGHWEKELKEAQETYKGYTANPTKNEIYYKVEKQLKGNIENAQLNLNGYLELQNQMFPKHHVESEK